MTITEAQTLLKEKFPNQSFKIELTVWHWAHYTPPQVAVEWIVYIADADHHHAPTLELAVGLALGKETPAQAEQSIDVVGVAPVEATCKS